MSIKLTKGY